MLFVLVLGLLLGGATVVLLQQWRCGVLAAAPPPRARLPRSTLREPRVARPGGVIFVPAGRRRDAA